MFRISLMSKLFLIFTLSFLFQACQKDKIPIESIQTQSSPSEMGSPTVFNVGGQSSSSGNMTMSPGESDFTQTVLGDLRTNPYTVEIMAQAYNNLHGTSLQVMPTTDLYVKFTPTSLEDMDKIIETDVFTLDFPWEYEVIEMGDYYQEIVEGTYPTLYAVVKPDFQFPAVNYEIVANLHLDESDPALIIESFDITSNTDPPLPEGGPPCDTTCTNWPDCLNGDTPCNSGDPLPDPDPDPDPSGSVYIQNSCGCQVYNDTKKPGGCVKLEDTELSSAGDPSTYEGVRRVRVTAKNGWFKKKSVWTDDEGCWKINDRFGRKIYVWIKFRHARVRIRGVSSGVGAAWQWLGAVRDYVGKVKNAPFNNISVNYNMWANVNSRAHLYWGAATVSNALHEFHDEAAVDGINPPPMNLDILLGNNQTYGYALMSGQNIIGTTLGSTAAVATSIFAAPLAPLIGVLTWQGTLAYMPEVFVGTDFTHSDNLKWLAFHELAHASHFTQVGSVYWDQLAVAEILNNGHGSPTSLGADIISVCESWADHIGHTYAHRVYLGSANFQPQTWEGRLEATWHETQDHIPIGLYHDLADGGIEPQTSWDQGSRFQGVPRASTTAIIDNVSGFTNAQMFSSLTWSTLTIGAFQTSLISNHLGSTSNTLQQVNDLFNSY